MSLSRRRRMGRNSLAVMLVVVVAFARPSSVAGETLAGAIEGKWPRPDLVVEAAESDDPGERELAANALSKWWPHVPGNAMLLRRLVRDMDTNVQNAAIETAVHHASVETIEPVAKWLLSRPKTRDENQSSTEYRQRTFVTDLLDRHAVRRFWRESDPFGLRAWMVDSLQRRDQPHTYSDLIAQPIPPASSAVIESGRTAFQRAQCATCHRVAGYGQPIAPDLKAIGECYDHATLIRHVLEPSLDIHDAGRAEQILTVDDDMIVGQIIDETSDALRLRVDPFSPQRIMNIAKARIRSRRPSTISPMPTGLLNGLTPTQVVDLVLFLRTDGGQRGTLPTGNHDDH